MEDFVKIDTQVSLRSARQKAYARVISWRRYVTLAGLALASFTASANAEVLPTDGVSLCQFKPSEFASWFDGGAVTTDGRVTPANSLLFNSTVDAPNHTHCYFHKWAARMFLWLTSPRDNGRVFQSPEFYTVSPPVDGKRSLSQNAPGKEDLRLLLRSAKPVESGGGAGTRRGVLMAQSKSLVYTLSLVNDVYAYFMTGVKNHALSRSRFPINSDDLEAIKAFARVHTTTLGHPEVLTMELKTTWVETAGLREAGLDPSKYIRINALIPTYDTSDPTQQKWIPKNEPPKKAELALVGMHIAGSSFGHPDMMWATFEHVDNVPVAPYQYESSNGIKQSTPGPGPWLFSRSDSRGPFNEPRMHARHEPNIEAEPHNTIGPSDTRRENAWGGLPNDHEFNSRVISVNTGTMQRLQNDVRANYLLIGTVWNLGAGSNRLANSTLETYEQTNNCFFCHDASKQLGVSHIYESLTPLFPQAPR
jgi:hypothetical protein